MPGRVLFVCALGSGRSLLAAGLLQSLDPERWEAWSASPTTGRHDIALVEQVLHEQGRMPLSNDRRVMPAAGVSWEEIILLCSGDTGT
jgi:protein-tyrosine-phosphatase